MIQQSCTLLRLAQVLERFPVSRSKWYEGVKSGRFPAPVETAP
ncbi:AlpA family phage regulatory protein [Curvibacter sp. RS43]|nr:AlpA family phage regulatory protein [Curvibacter sp. RS43]MDD0812191.1 AlpA family phage regulatory protein [Curvibacter sp. RS43]